MSFLEDVFREDIQDPARIRSSIKKLKLAVGVGGYDVGGKETQSHIYW